MSAPRLQDISMRTLAQELLRVNYPLPLIQISPTSQNLPIEDCRHFRLELLNIHQIPTLTSLKSNLTALANKLPLPFPLKEKWMEAVIEALAVILHQRMAHDLDVFAVDIRPALLNCVKFFLRYTPYPNFIRPELFISFNDLGEFEYLSAGGLCSHWKLRV